METAAHLISAGVSLLTTHVLQFSLFILLIWSIDRLLPLPINTRYLLWSVALAKMFVPPLLWCPDLHIAPVHTYITHRSAILLSCCVFFLTVYYLVYTLRRLRSILHKHDVLYGLLYLGNPQPISRGQLAAHYRWTRERVFVAAEPTILGPVLTGVFHRRIYLDQNWNKLSTIEQRAVLEHEAGHGAFDQCLLLLQIVSLILFGWNPLVRTLNRNVTLLRELCCDRRAIAATGIAPAAYARLLLAYLTRQSALARLDDRLPVVGSHFLDDDISVIEERIKHILTPPQAIVPARWWHYFVPLLAGFAVLPSSPRLGLEVAISPRQPEGSITLNQEDTMPRSLVGPLLTVLVLTSACGDAPNPSVSTVVTPSNVPAASLRPLKIAVLFDQTGSMGVARTPAPSPGDFQPLLRLLQTTGGELAVGAIRDASNLPLLRLRLDIPPAAPVAPSQDGNRFIVEHNMLAHQRALTLYNAKLATYQSQADQKINGFLTALRPLTARKADAPNTDLSGAVERAELFVNEPDAGFTNLEPRRYLVLATDGLDNVRKAPITIKSGATVILVNGTGSLGALAGLKPARFESLEAAFRFLTTTCAAPGGAS